MVSVTNSAAVIMRCMIHLDVVHATPGLELSQGKDLGISWCFYGNCSGHRHRLRSPGRPPSSQTSPAMRPIMDVTIVRPSPLTESPLSGLFTGGDGPRSAMTRVRAERVSTA